MTQTEKKRFKDWFDQEAAEALATQLSTVYPSFNQKGFIKSATLNIHRLEMGDRVKQFSESMALFLPDDKKEALEIIHRSLPPLLPDVTEITQGWLQWPVGNFIADYGLPHLETSFAAMIDLTQCFTSEFAVRPFIEAYPEECLSRLLELCTHPSPHVRRWCSEGTRPLLPWGKKLKSLVHDPSPVWPLLEKLKDDPEKYVQKSVANHLNDISKNHPDLVVARCELWLKEASPDRQWIVKHGLRSLIKQGHPEALALIGYKPVKALACKLTSTPEVLSIGEHTLLELTLMNHHSQTQKLLIDYAVTYVRQKGKTGRKVFKWTQITLEPEEHRSLTKKHSMRMTTVRALYPGEHRVEIQVNGQPMATTVFQLTVPT
ncbi:DNA alkylation repair protein [Kiritimatiellota bacterium B12222]|nr:DNA alkylation repair protein [Kiritimatiellota bacterium B12222]